MAKNIPMPFKDESEEDYSKRLDDLGITDEDFEAAMSEEFPDSDFDVTDAQFTDEPMDEDDDSKK